MYMIVAHVHNVLLEHINQRQTTKSQRALTVQREHLRVLMDPAHVLLTLSAQMNITQLRTTMMDRQVMIELVDVWQDTIEVIILVVVTVFPQGVNALLQNSVITCVQMDNHHNCHATQEHIPIETFMGCK